MLDFVLDFFFLLYAVAGSSSLGYLFLRSGWPKIRVLAASYKKGWSFVFGASFFVVVAMIALVLSLSPFFGIGFREFFFALMAVSFVFSVGALTLMRKFFKKQKVNLVVPGLVLSAKVAAAKAQGRLELDPGLVIVNAPQEQLEELKKRLNEKRRESLSSVIPQKLVLQKEALHQKDGPIVFDVSAPLLEKIPKKEQLLQKQPSFVGMSTDDLLLEIEGKIAQKKKQEEERSKNLPMVIGVEENPLENFLQKKAVQGRNLEPQAGGKTKGEPKAGNSESPLKRLLSEKNGKLKALKEGFENAKR